MLDGLAEVDEIRRKVYRVRSAGIRSLERTLVRAGFTAEHIGIGHREKIGLAVDRRIEGDAKGVGWTGKVLKQRTGPSHRAARGGAQAQVCGKNDRNPRLAGD